MNLSGISVFWGLAPLLIATIYFDLRYMRLPNAISLTMVALFVVWAPFALETPEIFRRVLVASTVLGIGIAAFAAKLVGGGDVKVLSALFLFIHLQALTTFLLLFGVCLVLGTAVVVLLRKAVPAKDNWAFLSATGRFPMGLAIGSAGLLLYGI